MKKNNRWKIVRSARVIQTILSTNRNKMLKCNMYVRIEKKNTKKIDIFSTSAVISQAYVTINEIFLFN